MGLFTWLIHYLKKKLLKLGFDLSSSLEGEVSVKSMTLDQSELTLVQQWTEKFNKSVILQVDVPPAPLFKEQDFIPQVPLFNLLEKFNGESQHESITKSGESREVRKYCLRKLPPYAFIQICRFKNNNYFIEKNPTLVTFPLKDLDLEPYIQRDALEAGVNPVTKYNLVANLVHTGKPKGGKYLIQIYHRRSGQWYEVQDLRVTPILPQAVALAESYVLLYERVDVKADGEFGEALIEELEKFEPRIEVQEEEAMDLEAMGIQIA